jgi:hypothetical protein
MEKIYFYNERKAEKTTIWLLFLFFGWSYGSLGKGWLQFLFYITLGGFGIWTLIRLFTLNKAIKKYNYKIANEVGLNKEEIISLGLY